jgi:hypothetical protein
VRRIDLSRARLASSEDTRDNNRDIVLELIRFRQSVPRVGPVRFSARNGSTISIILEQPISERWIRARVSFQMVFPCRAIMGA